MQSFSSVLNIETECLTAVSLLKTTTSLPCRTRDNIIHNEWCVVPSKHHQKNLKKVLRDVVKHVTKHHDQLCLRGALSQHPMLVKDRVDTLHRLRNTKQPEQRSEEWFNQREEQITASVFGKLKSIVARRTLAFQKATQIRERGCVRNAHKSSGIACEWGVMFEEVCKKVYEHLCDGAVVEEFGLLPHTKYPFIGASPDGICNENSTCEYIGRLVEFKAPFSRKIKHNHVPKEYLAQIQGQLEVTQLECCDYLECVFKTESKEDAQTRQSHHDTTTPICLQGMIVQQPGKSAYLYSSVNNITEASLNELVTICNSTLKDVNVIYWYLEDYQKVSVHRNSAWFTSHLLPKLKNTYEMLTEFANNDDAYQKEFEARQQKKKLKKNKSVLLFRN